MTVPTAWQSVAVAHDTPVNVELSGWPKGLVGTGGIVDVHEEPAPCSMKGCSSSRVPKNVPTATHEVLEVHDTALSESVRKAPETFVMGVGAVQGAAPTNEYAKA